MGPRKNRWTSRSWKNRRRYVKSAGPIWARVRQNCFLSAWILIWSLFWPIDNTMWSVKTTEWQEWKIAVTMNHGWARRNMIFTWKKVTKMVDCCWAMGEGETEDGIQRESMRPSKRAWETKRESARKSRRNGPLKRSDGRRVDLSDLWLQKGSLGF